MERLRGNRALAGALSAITAAVVGVILNLAVWFALHTAFTTVDTTRRAGVRLLLPQLATLDVAAVALMVLAGLLIFRFSAGVLRTLGICAGLGLVIALLGAT
jgi:chromate transporter